MRSLRNVALIFSGLVLCAGSAFSQTDWPTRPITIVVPFPVGGQTDVVARIIADKVHWHCAELLKLHCRKITLMCGTTELSSIF